MPSPASGTTIPRPDLGTVAYEFWNLQGGMIGTQVLPIFDTEEQRGFYPIIPREALLKLPDTARAPRGKYQRGDYEFEKGEFTCEENGWEEPLDDVERKRYARLFDAEVVATQRGMRHIMANREKRIADAVFNTSTFTATTVTHEWDDATNAVPLSDVNAGKKAIRDLTGVLPNTLIIAYSTFLDLGVADDIIDRIKFTDKSVVRGELSVEQLAQYFGVQKVLVGWAGYDAGDKGQATSSITDFWSNEYAMLCITDSSRDLQVPRLGVSFLWTMDSPQSIMVEEYREEQTRSDIFRTRQHTDEVITAVGAGYLLDNITT